MNSAQSALVTAAARALEGRRDFAGRQIADETVCSGCPSEGTRKFLEEKAWRDAPLTLNEAIHGDPLRFTEECEAAWMYLQLHRSSKSRDKTVVDAGKALGIPIDRVQALWEVHERFAWLVFDEQRDQSLSAVRRLWEALPYTARVVEHLRSVGSEKT